MLTDDEFSGLSEGDKIAHTRPRNNGTWTVSGNYGNVVAASKFILICNLPEWLCDAKPNLTFDRLAIGDVLRNRGSGVSYVVSYLETSLLKPATCAVALRSILLTSADALEWSLILKANYTNP